MTKSKKSGKTLKIFVTMIIIICLVIPVTYFYYDGLEEKDKSTNHSDKTIDNQINPLTPLGVYIKMHRIRKKGIIDVMMNSGLNIFDYSPTTGSELQQIFEGLRPGFGWDKKPIFSYNVEIEGFSWDAPIDYETWDTDYMNQIIKMEIEDEKPSVEIKLTFLEKEKKLLKTQVSKTESYNIVYDFRNGTWTGDDYFNDSDGYGHFDSPNFEIWFSIFQTDFDGDKIPYWTEVNILNTNPKIDDSKQDPDHDGVPTSWEWRWGYDPFIWENHTFMDPDVDGLENIEEYIMAKWLANPFYKDMYIEVDEMEKAPKKLFDVVIEKGKIIPVERLKIKRSRFDGWDHVFWEESQQMLMERFNEHEITVHIDDGIMGGGGDTLPFSSGSGAHMFSSGVVAGLYENYFSEERKGIFRYLCVIHGGGWCTPQDETNWPDCMTVPSNQQFFERQLNMAVTPRTKRIGRAIQVIHELGHCLGMNRHIILGIDNTSKRYDDPENYPWYDYVSVMNYDYFRQRYFDYSDGTHGENDHDDWNFIDLTYFQKTMDKIYGIEW